MKKLKLIADYFKSKSIRIKKRILMYRKSIYWYMLIFVLIAIEIVTILITYFQGLLKLEKEMLFWLFAATSQSMAALFAVVGMFSVFRLETIQSKLRNRYGLLIRKFLSDVWMHYFGDIGADRWHDNDIKKKAEYYLSLKEERLPAAMKNDLQRSIIEISHFEHSRDKFPKRARNPMVAIFFTFMMSVLFLPFSNSLSDNLFGLGSLIILVTFISFSMINIYGYFRGSISIKY